MGLSTTALTLAVQALPTIISMGKTLLEKLDDDDPNTGLIAETAKGISTSLKQGVTDIKSIGGDVADKAKEIVDSAEAVAAKIDHHLMAGGNDKH